MTAGALQVETLEEGAMARWDAFVQAQPQATFFHKAGWKTVIERAFHHRAYFLYVTRNERIEGVLPLVHVRSRLFTNALISTPFCAYGGAAAETEAARAELERAACDLARDLRVDYLELRERSPRHCDWPTKDLYYTFRKEISASDEENLRAIPRKQRAVVRKGIKAGLKSVIETDVERLYQIYSESVRNLGTPVFSKKYLETLRQVFGEDCEVVTVFDRDDAVSSVMNFYFRDEVLPYYGGGVAAARRLKSNDFMYWEVMRRAGARGVRIFDYGRSKADTGSFRFKKHWGFEPQPLNYEYFLVGSEQMPDLSPANPRYQYMIAAWKRLPLRLSQLIGPPLARSLG